MNFALLRGLLLAVSAAAMLAAGCSDSAQPPREEGDARPGLPTGDAGVMVPDMEPGEILPGSRELTIDGPISVLAFFGETKELPVIYRRANGTPVAGARIEAVMLDEGGNEARNGIEGTGLRNLTATTDANGRAVFEVQAGNLGVAFQVRASASGADPVFWDVRVVEEGQGSLLVRVNYNAAMNRYDFMDIDRVRVTVFDNQNCLALGRTPTALNGAVLEEFITPFNSVRNRVEILDLGAADGFSVAVQGQTSDRGVITFGCADNVSVTGGMVTDIEVEMDDLPLSYKGVYYVESELDLTSVLNNSEDETLRRIGLVLRAVGAVGGGIGDGEFPRGNAIIDLICEFADIGDGTCATIRGFGARLIEETINNLVPMDVLRILDIIGDIYRIISQFTIVAEFEFVQQAPDENNQLLSNDHRWRAFSFVWRNGCPFDTLEECTQTFGGQELGLDMRALTGTFDAELEGPEMHILPHNMVIRYGTIALGIAETWIIPAILGSQGPITLAEMLGTVIPCEDINDALTGNPQSDLCEEVLVEALGALITEQLAGLTFDADQFTLEGWIDPSDRSGDLGIDTLANGEWTGVLSVGGNQLVFDGRFRGCLRPGPDADCELPEWSPMMP